MKKVFMVLAVAGFLVSCDNSADSAKRLKDSTDSATKAQTEAVQKEADSTKKMLENAADTTKKVIDSLHKDTTKH